MLVRHGESAVQVSKVVGGMGSCSGLSDLGRRQVGALADRWARGGAPAADRLVSSALPRAQETAAILVPALGGLEVEADPGLNELEPGECDGITWEEYAERYAVDMRSDPYAPLSPGGESVAEFLLRVGRSLHRLAVEGAGQTIVVACHGGIVDGSLRNFLGIMPRGRSLWFRTGNSSVTEWDAKVVEGHPVEWALLRYNDVAHLEALGLRQSP